MGQSNEISGIRAFRIALAVALGLAVVGFFVGTRASARSAPLPTTVPTALADATAAPGQTYAELRTRRFGKNSRPTSDLAVFRQNLPKAGDEVAKPTPEAKRAALKERAERRAYFGAPPIIPHPIDDESSGSCLACHESGLEIEDKIAPPISHPPYANCLQCHAPSVGRIGGDGVPPANTFTRLDESAVASRAWPGAPPRMPHGVWMRQNCGSCHGLVARAGIRTPHPNRQNCQQCHVPEGAVPP